MLENHQSSMFFCSVVKNASHSHESIFAVEVGSVAEVVVDIVQKDGYVVHLLSDLLKYPTDIRSSFLQVPHHREVRLDNMSVYSLCRLPRLVQTDNKTERHIIGLYTELYASNRKQCFLYQSAVYDTQQWTAVC